MNKDIQPVNKDQPPHQQQPAAAPPAIAPTQAPKAAQVVPAPAVKPAPAPKPHAPTPTELLEFCALAVRIGPYLTLEQRKSVIVAVGDPKPIAPPATPSPYQSGKMYRFRVSWAEETGVVEAPDDLTAWAMFCDSIKRWPSPKARKVECLGEVEPQAAA